MSSPKLPGPDGTAIAIWGLAVAAAGIGVWVGVTLFRVWSGG